MWERFASPDTSLVRRSRVETSVKLEFSLGIKNRFPIFRIPETFTPAFKFAAQSGSIPSTRTFPEETVNELERRWRRRWSKLFSNGGVSIIWGGREEREEVLAEFTVTLFLLGFSTVTGGGDLVCKYKRREKGRNKIFSFERRLRCLRKLNLENLSNTKWTGIFRMNRWDKNNVTRE